MAMQRNREQDDGMITKVVSINRVSKTVKGGRVMKFAALIVVGDGKGNIGYGVGKSGEVPEAIRKGEGAAKKNMHKVAMKGTTIPHEIVGEFGAGRVLMRPAAPGAGIVGFGIGKAAEVPDAIRKGIEDAKKHLTTIALRGSTIPHDIMGEFGAGRVILKPAAPGTGVIAGGPVRAVLECAGIKDIRTKSLRSNNPINVTAATFAGLCGLTDAESVAAKRGKTVAEILG